MDKTTLVREDHEILDRVVQALSRANIPVTLVEWDYVSETEEGQLAKLVIGTPLHDSKGPHEAYSRVIEALERAGFYEKVPMLRVSVLSPEASVVRALAQEVKNRTEGNIHILAYDPNQPDDKKEYSVIFAPFAGSGGAVPAKHLTGTPELRKFLEEHLHIRRSPVEEALLELGRKGHASIFNVQLTARERKRLGLA